MLVLFNLSWPARQTVLGKVFCDKQAPFFVLVNEGSDLFRDRGDRCEEAYFDEQSADG